MRTWRVLLWGSSSSGQHGLHSTLALQKASLVCIYKQQCYVIVSVSESDLDGTSTFPFLFYPLSLPPSLPPSSLPPILRDLQALTQDLGIRMKTHRKGSDASDKRAAFRDIEEQTIALGKKTRNEVSR